MDALSVAQMILSTAIKIYKVIDEVQYFKKRSARLEDRIKNLTPAIDKLASSEQHVPPHARTPQGMKLFSIPLGGIRQLFERILLFLEKLKKQKFPFFYKLFFKDAIGQRFDEFSEELNSKTNALLLALNVEKREVSYDSTHRLEDDRADQKEDEKKLLEAYREGSEKVEGGLSKLMEGNQEIKKMLEGIKSLQTCTTGTSDENQSTFCKDHSVQAVLKQIDPNQLTDRSDIGQGRFGRIEKAVYKHEIVAVKSFSTGNDKNLKEILLKEAENLLKLNSLYVVRLWGVSTKEDPCLLVFEYMAKGSLREVLDRDGADMAKLPWERRIQMALDGALGLFRMHNTDPSPLMHQDVASDIFLVDDNWKMKISGVGFAKTKSSILRNSRPARNKRDTLYYISPQRLNDINYKPDEHSDIYSYGIVMWEIASRSTHEPYEDFKEDKDREIKKFVLHQKKLPLPKDCPDDFKTVINECRNYEPDSRPNASDIVDKLQKLTDSLQQTWC